MKQNGFKSIHFKLVYFKSNDYICGVKLMICAMESPFVYGKMAESGTCQHHRPDKAVVQ